MKITVLTSVEKEGDRHFDAVVPQVVGALREGGHEVSVQGAADDVKRLVNGLARRRPGLVFNILEEFGSSMFGAVQVAGLLDLLGVPYTGGGPGELYLGQDKALTKKLLAFDNVRYPDFAVFSQNADLETGGSLRMPLFVKPLRMDGSIGVDGKSVVRSPTELLERVQKIHRDVRDAALAEEFIEGREFYVGVLGNQNPTAFPPVEMDFSKLPADKPHILDAKAKWHENSAEYKGTEAVLKELPDELRAKLQKVALDAYRALRVRDYGRVDMRLTETGDVYVIEVNASCYLERDCEFARAAAAAGVEYPALVNKIVELAQERRRKPV